MKRDPIIKMYNNLTPKQQATLAFNHLLNGNEAETDKIINAVAYKNYRCKDLEFQDQFESYRTMVQLWSLEYWQLYAQQLEALVRLNIYIRRKDWIKADQVHEELEHIGSCLSATVRALQSVCEAQGIDADTVKNFAECKSTLLFSPDEEYRSIISNQLEVIVF